VKRNNGADGPASGNGIHHAIYVVAEPFAAAEGQLIHGIAAEYVLGIEITGRIVSSRIIKVLVIRIRWNTL
jgi:hypothetical protein